MKKKYIIPKSAAESMSPELPLAAGSVRDLNTGVEMIYNGEGSSGPARSRDFSLDWDDEEDF
ncbi:MAG: hypothetical protein J5610_05810 [Prevotella sp.]|nr:hypothetical protein [Prevotella sp.]